jgi:hypothetical protein
VKDLMLTADTITDQQIRELRDTVRPFMEGYGNVDETARARDLLNLCGVALARPAPDATGRGNGDIAAWRKARARCAEILNARQEAT